MTQVSINHRLSPKQALARIRPLDERLDPEWFRAMGDPTRLRMLACLIRCARPCTVGEIAECCSVDLSVVSRHLRMLERAGILRSTKAGRSVSYAVCFGELCGTLRGMADLIETCGPGATCDEQGGACCTPVRRQRSPRITRKSR